MIPGYESKADPMDGHYVEGLKIACPQRVACFAEGEEDKHHALGAMIARSVINGGGQ